jgi:hypothetical protein
VEEQAIWAPEMDEESKKRGFREKLGDFWPAIIFVLLRICCFLLFEAPVSYNDALEPLWVEKTINHTQIQHFIEKTMKDWGDISLLASVLWT